MIMGMADLRIRLYGPPDEELGSLTGGEAPEWAARLYGLFGESPRQVSAGAAVSALAGELEHRLKKLAQLFGAMERNGWVLELDGEHIRCHHDALTDAAARAQLEKLGVWLLVPSAAR
jgi:hypothetical protein